MSTHLEVGCEGVGQAHAAREGGENEIPHLDTVGRNNVAEPVVVVTQELREIVQQDQQHTQRTPVQPTQTKRVLKNSSTRSVLRYSLQNKDNQDTRTGTVPVWYIN